MVNKGKKNNRGSVALDLVLATAVIALLALTVVTCVRLNNMVVMSNMQINDYQSRVITKMTELEGMDTKELKLLDNTQKVEGKMKYKYTCRDSGHNTLRVEVVAIQDNLEHKFIAEKVYTE